MPTDQIRYTRYLLIAFASILAVVALLVIIYPATSNPVQITKLGQTDHYVSQLEIQETPTCSQDHFTLVGRTADQAEQVIEIMADDSRVTQRSVPSPRLSAGQEFALSSPVVDERLTSTYKVFAIVADSKPVQIATITANARCSGEE